MARKVFPEITTGGLSRIGHFIFDGNPAQQRAFGIVSVFVAAIADGPSLRDVVGNGGRGGPDVSVAGDIAAIVEIVQDPELAREFVLIRGDVSTVHGERRIAVRFRDVAEDLIVRPIFLDDVDDVVNRVLAAGERNAIAVTASCVGLQDLRRVSGKSGRQICK